MKLKSLIGDILLVIIGLFFITATSVGFYRDWMFRDHLYKAIAESHSAISEGDDKKLVNAVRDVQYNICQYYDQHIFLRRAPLDKACEFVKFATNNDRIQNDADFLHILVEPLRDIANALCRTSHYKVSSYRVAEMVTDYNFNWKAPQDEISKEEMEQALKKDPDVLVLYDVACRYYYRKGDDDMVITKGMQSFKYEGAALYRADILYYMKQALSHYGTINWDAEQFVSTTASLSGIDLNSYTPLSYIPFVEDDSVNKEL